MARVRRSRRWLGAVVALAAAAGFGSAARAQELTGYDGSNPFDCQIQQLGTGTSFPDPDADPFCVEYDKRHQNVLQLGIVDFLSKEPARVAAASPKCFYYQRDHWRGSLSQDDPVTQTYTFDGSYYFDKARGAGGVYVENFAFAGQSGDPSALPGFPEEYKPYFGQGRGGVQGDLGVTADPRCAAAGRDPPARGRTGEGEGDAGGGRERAPEEPAAGGGEAPDTRDPGFSEARRAPSFAG